MTRTSRQVKPEQTWRYPQHARPVRQCVQVTDWGAILDSADVGLTQSQPLTQQGLRDASGPVDGMVMRVRAVSAGYPADVLSRESLLKLFDLPELGWHLGWTDELATGGALTSGALACGVVGSQIRPATTIPAPGRPRSHLGSVSAPHHS